MCVILQEGLFFNWEHNSFPQLVPFKMAWWPDDWFTSSRNCVSSSLVCTGLAANMTASNICKTVWKLTNMMDLFPLILKHFSSTFIYNSWISRRYKNNILLNFDLHNWIKVTNKYKRKQLHVNVITVALSQV
jgi:hypothetical protein